MFLRSLQMQGFKSFPDKMELKFGKGITAVVGPNGSGKSNISDAVRWVLGETSTKSLRGTKMEDVIFGGTSTRKPLGFAQVALTLDNTDGSLKDKDDIVTVTRRFYRSGESEYRIDGQIVRRKDIHELFMDTGLGSDGYSMVGQGKIDSIISAKNEDRRELFEEAAGISRFRHKRKDAEKRLDQSQENLVRLLDILGELENRVGPLKTQSEKAKKFIELSKEKKTLEIGVWLNKINKFTNQLREQEHKIDATNIQYNECENDLTSIEQEIEKVSQDVAIINTQIEQIRSDGSQFEEDALRKDGEINVLQTTLQHNNQTIDRLKNDVDFADESTESIDNQIKQKQEFIAQSDEKCSKIKIKLQEITSQMEQISTSNEEFSQKSILLNQKMTSLAMKLSDYRVKSSQALSSIDEIKSRQNIIDETILNCKKDIDVATKSKDESQQNIGFINERIDQCNNEISGYKLKLKNKNDKAQELKNQLDDANKLLQEKQSKAKMLTDLEKNMDGFSGAVKSVMQQSKNNSLGGIHGPLSQLISVENQYSTAIEVALGAAMQNIVTTNESDAKRAIYYLKQNHQGRCTFLPISAIKSRNFDEKSLDDNLGFVSIASDLVDCDNKYKDIISNLLGRVVIVEDMDSAIGIAKQYKNRFKIVTLDGQVINAGGSMSGGSRAKGAGVLSRANTIEQLKNQAEKCQKEVENLYAQYKSAIENANKAAADLQGTDAHLRNYKEDLIRSQGDFKLVSDKLDLLTSQLHSLTLEKENAQGRIDLFNKASEDSKKEIAQIQNQIDTTEKEIDLINGNTSEITKQREDIRQQSEQLNLQLVTIAKDSQTAKISIEELENRKNTQSDRVKTIVVEINEIQQKNQALQLNIEELINQSKELRLKSQNCDNSVKEQIENRDLKQKHSNELRILEKNKNQQREQLSGQLVRLDERKIAMRKEYDELNDMLFEQYELNRRQAQALNIVIEDMVVAKKRLHEIKVSIKGLGSINVGAIEEYNEVSQRYEYLKEQIDDIEKAKSELMKIIDDLTTSMSEKFLLQFNKINEEFKVSFADFFGGGKGELILEDPDHCLESQIEIKIQPPGKSVQNINLFSGGEKSLAAMALLFSVLKVQPSPFCIYDEVEAALDDVNVERFAKYMRKMTDHTQFISITHRRGTMEEADVLYGVTMQEKGVSKLLELQSAELASKMGLDE